MSSNPPEVGGFFFSRHESPKQKFSENDFKLEPEENLIQRIQIFVIVEFLPT